MSRRNRGRRRGKPAPVPPTIEFNFPSAETVNFIAPAPVQTATDSKVWLNVAASLIGIVYVAFSVGPSLGSTAQRSILAWVAPHTAPGARIDAFVLYTYDTAWKTTSVTVSYVPPR